MKQVKPKLMNEPQMASWLNISIATLRRARKTGKIRFYRIGSWRVAYSEEQGEQFLTEHCQPLARPKKTFAQHASIAVQYRNKWRAASERREVNPCALSSGNSAKLLTVGKDEVESKEDNAIPFMVLELLKTL